MKQNILVTIFLLCLCFSISQVHGGAANAKIGLDARRLIDKIENVYGLVRNGEFTKTEQWIESQLRHKTTYSAFEIKILEKYLADIKAIKREYTLSYADVFKELQAEIPAVTALDLNRWDHAGCLEYYRIDGATKYFYACVADLFKLNQDAAQRAKRDKKKEYDATAYPLETIRATEQGGELVKKINLAFTFHEEVGNLPDHTLLKAWIPFIRENKFQSNIKLVRSSINDFILAKKDDLTATIYFEKKLDLKNQSNAEWRTFFSAPQPAWIKARGPNPFGDTNFVCQFIYSFESLGVYKPVDPAAIQPYNLSDRDFYTYTAETETNLFTPYLIKLSHAIVGQETNPYLKGKKIYQWVCENIVWTVSKPVLGDYREYTAKYRRGDCGEKANLFISLCRINHIPARAQGGWGVDPKGSIQHSWAQAYFEPLGWLPVDTDAGSHLIHHADEKLRFFYFGNRTPYRLIIYDDDRDLVPAKAFPCIYGGGAQLGAFEWASGDIEPNIIIDSHIE